MDWTGALVNSIAGKVSRLVGFCGDELPVQDLCMNTTMLNAF
jgi:hypothetical protein